MVYKIPLEIITIDFMGYHLKTSAIIEGIPGSMVVDTGASMSVIDSNRIHLFLPEDRHDFEPNPNLSTGLGTDSMESRIASLQTLSIGDLMIHDLMIVLIDLQHINASFSKLGLPPVDGVIGGDLLMRFKATINYPNRLLTLRTR
ncbi:MAG: clan AA aspartic protease [Bacteroidetes bacterium]|nr:clan AA aspartic protease [Bacteroidota bacterium]